MKRFAKKRTQELSPSFSPWETAHCIDNKVLFFVMLIFFLFALLHCRPWCLCASLSSSEHGDFLALDLGGSSFRVLLVQVQRATQCGKKRKVTMQQKIYSIPQETMQGSGEEVKLSSVKNVGVFLKFPSPPDKQPFCLSPGSFSTTSSPALLTSWNTGAWEEPPYPWASPSPSPVTRANWIR